VPLEAFLPTTPKKGDRAMLIVISNYNFSTVTFPGESFIIFADDEQISINAEKMKGDALKKIK